MADGGWGPGRRGPGGGRQHARHNGTARDDGGRNDGNQHRRQNPNYVEHAGGRRRPDPASYRPIGELFGFRDLQDFAGMTGQAVLDRVTAREEALYRLIEYRDMRPDWVPLVIDMLAKVCGCGFSERGHVSAPSDFLVHVLNRLRGSPFIKVHLLLHLTSMPAERSTAKQRGFLDAIRGLLTIFRVLLTCLPHSVRDILPVLTTMDYVVRSLRTTSLLDDPKLDNELTEVLKIRDETMKQQQQEAAGAPSGIMATRDEDSAVAPPEDYREIPLIPTLVDLTRTQKPYLRRIIIRGPHKDVEHYLDVQFRLMREDFLKPLRDGITQYTANVDAEKREKTFHVYHDVHVVSPLCRDRDGISYKVTFDQTRLRGVRWDSTKRLIFGSLVCLSADSFKTVVFATISGRDPEQLAQGVLELNFCRFADVAGLVGGNKSFIMAESPAYYEAYRHVLLGLQELSAANMPFAKYIVEARRVMEAPSYLAGRGRTVAYDLTPLMVAVNRDEHGRGDDGDEDEDDDEAEEDAGRPERHNGQLANPWRAAKAVPILSEERWPSAASLLMDESQLRAMRLALTNELSIIQGPPGTGKSYVGLNLVKLLLKNREVWTTNRYGVAEQNPILVICYTNHALDQFLEGIHQFQKSGIVRVGGRSKSPLMERFLLRELRTQIRQRRELPATIHGERNAALEELSKLRTNIENAVAHKTVTTQGLVHEDTLKEFMRDSHYSSLVSRSSGGANGKAILSDWLQLDGMRHPSRDRRGADGADDDADDDDDNAAGTDAAAESGTDVESLIGIETETEDEDNLRQLEGLEEEDYGPNRVRQHLVLEAAMRTLAIRVEQGDGANEPRGRTEETDWVKWGKTKHKHKKWKKLIEKEINKVDFMSERDAGAVDDVWKFSRKKRWQLYRRWIRVYLDSLEEDLRKWEEAYIQSSNRLRAVGMEEDKEIMRQASVLGMTTTGASQYRSVLQQIQPKIVIVEEAAEVLESHIVTALSPGCQHLIMIGDHKQLRPKPTVYRLGEYYNLKVSLFERLILNNIPYETLDMQHRMRPEIARLIQPIYPDLRDHEVVKHYGDIRGVSHNVFFIHHEELEEDKEDLQSKANIHEAEYLVALCRYLILHGYRAARITILVPYTGQLYMLKNIMPRDFFDGVRVCPIDRYQGEENDIILLSLVRSNTDDNIGFLNDDNRVCVAMSRAKEAIYIIGNSILLAEKSEYWSKVIEILKKSDATGRALLLRCTNHPEAEIRAVEAADFQKAPEGGCLKPCDARLSCGHSCVRACHVYDMEHSKYRCQKPCERRCANKKHGCKKKCFEECGKCTEREKTVMPMCGHTQYILCGQHVTAHTCEARCTRRLGCGHQCQNKCGEEHTTKCMHTVTRLLACGHSMSMKCHEKPEEAVCPSPCTSRLRCEHPCKGTCGQCLNGRLHKACQQDCGRTLVCGHQCRFPCTKDCPPCNRPCENRCVHSKCKKQCGELCAPCREPCSWRCPHFACTKLCHEPCDRPVCGYPCTKPLPCGHLCIGQCGETCPPKCRVCNSEEVETILFGTEDEPDARFVHLIDCDHVLEASGLDQWLHTPGGSDQQTSIQLKGCPLCKTQIRRNLRYGTIINARLQDLERVKHRILGAGRVEECNKVELRKSMADVVDECPELEPQLLEREKKVRFWTEEAYVCLINTNHILLPLLQLKRKLQNDKGRLSAPVIQELSRDCLVLRRWLLLDRSTFSAQELDEAQAELKRIQLLTKGHDLEYTADNRKLNVPQEVMLEFQRSMMLLQDGMALTADREATVTKGFRLMEKVVPASGLGITDKERIEIVQAMGLTAGHWYKCPNGHVYAIGDCGGATMEGRCPECSAAIGGTSHRLRSDNTLASEMDGATRSAWPGGAG